MKWLNKPITIGFFLKLFICINIIYWVLWYHIATISDYKDKETLQYYGYLENRIETQKQLINIQQELIKEYKK